MSRLEHANAWLDDYRERYDERTLQMARMYVEQGMNYEQIGKEHGLTRQRVAQLLGPMGLAKERMEERRVRRVRALEAAHARILTGDTSTRLEAQALGYTSVEAFRQALRELGLRMVPPDEPPHGTITRYQSRRFRCRCDLCRTANTEYYRKARAQRGEPPTHGLSGYLNYGCRCPTCKAAGRAANRNARIRRRARKQVPE